MDVSEQTEAELENAIRDGKVPHTLECDLLFAEFTSYVIERGDAPSPDARKPRGCECERRAAKVHNG